MEKLNIEYINFKTLATTYSLPIFYVENSQDYSLFASSKDFVYMSKAIGDDKTDFEANYKSISTLVASKDDAIALVCPVILESASGNPIVSKGLYVEGKTLTIQEGSDNGYISWTFPSLVELQGGDGQVIGGAKTGDYVEFSIWHPIYGKIYEFANEVYLYGEYIYEITSPLVVQLPAGLEIRMTYNASDTTGRNVICRLRMYK